MIKLSIDPGQNMGFAVWKNNKLKDSHFIKFKGQFEERLNKTLVYLMDILEKNEIELVIMESVEGGGAHWRPMAQLNQIKGLIKCVCFMADLYYEEIHQLTVKEITTGKGNSKKEIIQEHIKRMFGEKHSLNENQADAVAIGYTQIYLEEHPEVVKEIEERREKRKTARKKKRGKKNQNE